MNKKKLPGILWRVVAILIVVMISSYLRWHAITTLQIDYDEDDYLRAAQEYAHLIRYGDWPGFLETNYRSEHPPLSKIVYGLSILSIKESPLIKDSLTTAEPNQYIPRPLLKNARIVSGIFGVITAGVLALINPLAGLFLGIHAFNVKYTSQVMLESLPALTSFLAVICYEKWRKRRKEVDSAFGWVIASAVFLGLTAASKYIYCVVGLSVLIDVLIFSKNEQKPKNFWRDIILWSGSAVIVFFLFDPYIWTNPIPRLGDSIMYHASYSSGAAEVQNAGFPMWQPLNWLIFTPDVWQPDAFKIAIDPIITILAVIGLPGLWHRRRPFLIWLTVAMIFLLLWPTKWPQYIITLTVPLALSAAEGFCIAVINPIRNYIQRIRNGSSLIRKSPKGELKAALPWLVPGLVMFAVFTILPLIFQVSVSFTDFNSNSIKDGLNGGIFRAVWGGLTGQTPVIASEFPFQSTTVGYVGLKSYLPVLNYLRQIGILVYNFLWTILSVVLQAILGISVALLLWQRGIWLKQVWKVLFILPWAIPEMIGALMWMNIFQPEIGWLSLGVKKFGDSFPFSNIIGWESDTEKTLLVLLIAGVWYGFPFIMLATLTGLRMIPKDVLDAAEIDGANKWQTITAVIWPLLLPLVVPALIIKGIFAFNQFYLFQAFHQFQGTLATLSYNFFNPSGYYIRGQFSISAIVNIITMILLICFVIALNRMNKIGDGVEYA